MRQGQQIGQAANAAGVQKLLRISLVQQQHVQELQQSVPLTPIFTAIQHRYKILGVIEVADLLAAMAVHHRERLKAHGLHAGDRGQQKPVIEIAEELQRVVDASGLRVILQQQTQVVVPWGNVRELRVR